METPRIRLGELLVRAGLVSAPQLEEALTEQRRVGKRLGSLLVESGLVSETQVTQILSQQLSIPWVALHHIDFSEDLLARVPGEIAHRYCLIPIYVRRVRGLGDALYVAMDDPTNAQALVEVGEQSRLHVRAMIAPPSDIKSAIYAYYGLGDPHPRPARRPPEDDADEDDVKTGIHARSIAPAADEPSLTPKVTLPEEAPVEVPVVPDRVAPPSVAPPARQAPEVTKEPPPVSERRSSVPVREDAPPPPSSGRSAREPASKPVWDGASGERGRTAAKSAATPARKMIALTLLDGTTIQVPSKNAKDAAEPARPAPPEEAPDDSLTARDIVAALRAAARGVDASDILGENARWEAMFSALLSLLLKKHLISDKEFLEEFRRG